MQVQIQILNGEVLKKNCKDNKKAEAAILGAYGEELKKRDKIRRALLQVSRAEQMLRGEIRLRLADAAAAELPLRWSFLANLGLLG